MIYLQQLGADGVGRTGQHGSALPGAWQPHQRGRRGLRGGGLSLVVDIGRLAIQPEGGTDKRAGGHRGVVSIARISNIS